MKPKTRQKRIKLPQYQQSLYFWLAISGFVAIIAALTGFNFTDEARALNYMVGEIKYNSHLTFEEFIYAPISSLVRENVAMLRLLNIICVYALSLWALLESIRQINNKGLESAGFNRYFVYGIPCLSFFPIAGIKTANYNSLALIGCLLFTISLLRILKAETPIRRQKIFNLSILSLGLAISLAGKPTTFLALSTIAIALFTISEKLTLEDLCIIGIGTATITAIAITTLAGGFDNIKYLYHNGYTNAKLLGSGHSAVKLAIEPLKVLILAPIGPILIVFILLKQNRYKAIFQKLNPWIDINARTLINIYMVSATIVLVLIFTHTFLVPLAKKSISFGIYYLLILTPLSVAIQGINSSKTTIKRDEWLGFGLICLIPFAYGFGSTVIASRILSSGFFWIIASTYLVQVSGKKKLESEMNKAVNIYLIMAVPLLIAKLIVGQRTSNGFNQLNFRPINIRGENNLLLISKPHRDFIKYLRKKTQIAGFKPNEPMIDLTGQSPGVIYTLGGLALGKPWLIGGYPGSKKVAINTLNKVDKSLIKSAWILVDKDINQAAKQKYRGLNDVLKDLGLDLNDKEKFQLVVTKKVPQGIGNSRPREIYIFKPIQ